jgi:predicted secreted protein
MSVIHGKDIKINNSSGTALIAAAKSCTIHRQCQALPTASSTDGDHEHYIAGRKGWSIDLSHLVTTDGVTLDEGTTYNIQVAISSGVTWVGTALCTQCEIQATQGNLATGSIRLLGSGPLGPASAQT